MQICLFFSLKKKGYSETIVLKLLGFDSYGLNERKVLLEFTKIHLTDMTSTH